MMLTSKIPQAESSLEALSLASGGQETSENRVFSGLFSSMVAAQEEGTLDPLSQVEVPVSRETALNLVSESSTETQILFSASDIVNGVVTQLESSSSPLLKSESIIRLNAKVESDVLSLAQGELNPPSFSAEQPMLTENSTFISNSESAMKDRVPLSDVPQPLSVMERTEAPLVEVDSLDEISSPPLSTPWMPDSVRMGEESPSLGDLNVNQPITYQPSQTMESETLNVNVYTNTDGLMQGKQGVELLNVSVAQERAAVQGTSFAQTGSLAFNSNSQTSNSVLNQSTTSWGTQLVEGQASQSAGQQGHSFGQSGQQTSGQAAQQQAMIFTQGSQENRQRSLEQQMAIRAMDEATAKSEGKELLGGAEIASLDRKGSLPTGLQTINIPLKHPQWGQALGQRIVFMSNNSLQQAQITLNPQSLGQIQVTLQLDKDQKMHISLAAQNGITRESMESALPKLREMMEQAGVQVASVDVREQKQHFSENESRHEKHEKNRIDSALAEEGLTEEPLMATVGLTDNIVDYYA